MTHQEADARRRSFAEFGAAGAWDRVALRPSAGSGGGGEVWRTGDLVFKRAPSKDEWSWLGTNMPTIREDGFRLAFPVPARDGRWVVDGWCAQTWMEGTNPDREDARWLEVLRVCERFHRASAHLPRPTFVEHRTHRWAVGDRVAWGEAEPPRREALLDRLLGVRRPLDLPAQVIHGDLSQNVLFAPGVPPAVIDPTPYWRPAGFASAIVVADALVWGRGEPSALIDATASIDSFPQLLVRSLIFRLVAGESGSAPVAPAHPYSAAVDLACDLAR